MSEEAMAELQLNAEEAEEKMEKALTALRADYDTVRTGRANPALLDAVMVEAYGSEMPLKQMANVNTPDGSTIMVTPWDKGQLPAIERSIIASNLGLNPNNDGAAIRISIPPLTEERRKELAKVAAKMTEDARISIRHIRKNANDTIKKLEKAHELPEDVGHDAHDTIQKLTDRFIKQADDALKKKEEEIMAV